MTFNFAMQAIDQIINSAAKTLYMSGGQIRCSIVFRGPNGAAARVAAQHSQDYSSWYGHVPGLKVVAPYDAADAKGLLKAAIRDPNPVVFLEHEMLYGHEFDVPEVDDWLVPIGKAKVRREGDGRHPRRPLAHGRLRAGGGRGAGQGGHRGRGDRPAHPAPARPRDRRRQREEDQPPGHGARKAGAPMGVGAEVAARVVEHAFDYLDAPPARVCQEDVPLPYAANLEALSLPSVDKIVAGGQGGLLPMSEAAFTWRAGGCHCGAVRFEAALADACRGAGLQLLDLRQDRLHPHHRAGEPLPPAAGRRAP